MCRGLTAALSSGRRKRVQRHCGADHRLRAWSAGARCSCAADGETAGGRPPLLRHVFACCRAGYRCAQDLFRGHPDANPVRDPQLVEQFVEVPTEPAFVEQTVDIPVLGGGWRLRLRDFLPEQGSPACLQGFLPGQGSAASSTVVRSPTAALNDADEPSDGFFRTFRQSKKVRGLLRSRVRIRAERSSNGSPR